MIKHYKGLYRLKAPYDLSKKQFIRKIDGSFDDTEVYIDCAKDAQIYCIGKSTLECYIPSVIYGNNIIKEIYYKCINPDNVQIKESNIIVKNIEMTRINYSIINEEIFRSDVNRNSNIFDIQYTDKEVLFKFSYKNADKIIPFLKPKTLGASISPFSTKNLPKNRSYKIPDEQLEQYKNIVAKIPKECVLSITHTTNKFLKQLVNKKNAWEDIKADMLKSGLKGKEYIHSIGKWKEYIQYLEDNL